MWHRVTTASTFPVTLTEAKAQCRVDGEDDDALLGGLILAAHDAIGQMVGYPLAAETWAATLAGVGSVEIPLYPVSALVSVVLGEDDLPGFTLSRDGDAASVSGPWPAEAVTVSVTVGGFTPPAIKQAMLMLVSHWYENRETVSEKPLKEVPFAVDSLVSLYRRGWAKA